MYNTKLVKAIMNDAALGFAKCLSLAHIHRIQKCRHWPTVSKALSPLSTKADFCLKNSEKTGKEFQLYKCNSHKRVFLMAEKKIKLGNGSTDLSSNSFLHYVIHLYIAYSDTTNHSHSRLY